jgi:methylenetetrahydrofolate reductase (NADPH)
MRAEANDSASNLQRVLRAGHFALTCELTPPRSADPGEVKRKARQLKGNVDAVNLSDNPGATVRMSSWGASRLVLQEGVEPTYELVCRDRNRAAMQSDILGMYATGVRNALCLSGDHQDLGDHPEAKGVFDIDSMQLIHMLETMREQGRFAGGDEIDGAPRMFIGAACNPFADPLEFQVRRLGSKIRAGAEFIQTRCIFNMTRFREFIGRATDLGLLDRVYFLAGVTPLPSVAAAERLQTQTPAMEVPEAIIRRLQGVPGAQAPDEGIKIACEQIAELREIRGISGIHLMTLEAEHRVAEIAERCGLLPRP